MPASREQFLIKYQQSRTIPYGFDSKDNGWFMKEYTQAQQCSEDLLSKLAKT